MRPSSLVALLVTALLAMPAIVAAKCDPGANAGDLSRARESIDETCPCAAAASAGAHGRCAKTAVDGLVADGLLARTCRSDALKHAKKSICGRPGAVVCCRVRTANGKTSHTIARTADRCVSSASVTACASVFSTVDTGCKATGCLAPTCGNGIVEPTETCDPPIADVCDATCRVIPCDPPVTTCGNGALDAGEACEPPGTGTCGWECQTAPCAAPGPDEIAVACATGRVTVGVGARGTDYLAAWTDIVHRAQEDVVIRGLDVDGAPLTPARVATEDGPCGFTHENPAVGGNTGRYVLAWNGTGTFLNEQYPTDIVSSRSYENDQSLGAISVLATSAFAGFGGYSPTSPMAVAPLSPAGPSAFAVLYRLLASFVSFDGHVHNFAGLQGDRFDYTGPTGPDSLGFNALMPVIGSGFDSNGLGSPSVASTATDTLVVWHGETVDLGPPTVVTSTLVTGAWLSAVGPPAIFTISTRATGSIRLHPTVAAASDRFLVAWADGPTQPTEIRGMRVMAPGGSLDPDGGILLGTAAGTVTAGPVAAFDGTVWLVAWSETGVGGNDLRAVAVRPDGTIVDATPRLLASAVDYSPPAVASAGDGRSLVLYVQPDGANSAVRARLVPGM